MNLGPCYSIPNRFIKELKAYDSYLRVRWGKQEGIARVERKLQYRIPISPDIPIGLDDYEMRRDGYDLVLRFLPIDSLYPQLLRHLVACDLQYQGGAAAVSDRLESKEGYRRERHRWNRRDDFRVMGADLYRTMNTIKTAPEGAGHKAYPVELGS